ncbi:MAG: response regulator [Hespellia sp.]|nr:response regulator [Hespellia sp.]
MDTKLTMLIVDDIEANRATMAEAFSDEYRILYAENGKEAIDVIQKHGKDISIILLDMIMPVMNGMEVLRWIKNSVYSATPVIALTADESYQLEALENGAVDFIPKPADERVINARIKNVRDHFALEEERKINKSLEKSKLEMDNLINSIPGGIAIYRLSDHFETLYFSDGLAALSGYTREEYEAYIKGDASRMIYEKDRARVLAIAEDDFKRGAPIDVAYRICLKNGGLVWVNLNAVLIETDDEGVLVHAVYQKSPKMAQLYANLVNESQSAIYVSDTVNYDLLYINQSGLDLIGMSRVSSTGKKCYEVLFQQKGPCKFCKIHSMNHDQFMERDFPHPINDSIFHLRGKLIDWNGIEAHVEYIEDVTQSRKNEQENKELMKKEEETLNNYRTLVNTVPGGIALYEVDGNKIETQFYSDGLCELLGYSREEREVIFRNDAMALTYKEDIPLLKETIKSAVENHSNVELTYRINTKSGKPRWVNLRSTYLNSECGKSTFHAVFTDVDKIKNIEEAEKEQQLRYQVAIKSSGINVWEYNIQADILMVVSNSSRIKQNCFTIQNYVMSTVQNGYVREDSLNAFYSIFERLKNGEKEVSEDIWYKTTDEAGWWCEHVIYTTIFDEKGIPVKAFGAGRDVTREKEAIKKFNEEMSYRDAMQEANIDSLKINLTQNTIIEGDSPFGVLGELIDSNNADLYFSKTADYICGEKNKEEYRALFNRQSLLSCYSRGDYSVSMEFTRVFDTNKIYWIKYKVHLMKNPETKEVIAFVVASDTTDENVMKSIMETITRTDYDFFVVVDGTTDRAVDYTLNWGGKLFTENQPFQKRNEMLVRQVVCEEDVERVVEECRISRVLENIANGNVHKFDFNMRDENGRIRRKQVQLTLINWERKAYLMTRIDVTGVYEEQIRHQKELEQALISAKQANLAKSDFLARMSHDIRTPMNAIIGMTELARDENDSPKREEYLKNIDSSSHFLLGLINDILDLSKIESGKIKLLEEPFTMEEFKRNIKTVILPLMKAKHIDFAMNFTCNVNCILVDKLRFTQICFNLLSNAVKFTPEGGRIEFSFDHIPDRDGKYGMKYTVRDNGIGMSTEFQKHLFEPFSQENRETNLTEPGTGLGLAIVKKLVEAMGGTIGVTSAIGEGTEFVVEFHVFAVEADAEKEKLSGFPDVDISGTRILLVEDNHMNVVVAKHLLERKGCKVEVAVNGERAVQQFSKNTEFFYDAILMDVRMPVMGGIEATEQIRSFQRADAKSIPIIAMTADAFVGDQDKTKKAGMNAHLSKPIDPKLLYHTLYSFIYKNNGVKKENVRNDR